MGYKEDRLKICKGCDFYRDHFSLFGIKLFKKTPQCASCKCAIKYKTNLKYSNCPEELW